MKSAAVVVTLAISSPVVVRAQRYTIPELAAANPEKIMNMATMEDEYVKPLVELSTKADFVVDARLVRPRSYLSEDKMKIYTDYEIVPSRVIRSQIDDIMAGQTPGLRAPLLLTVPGGQITLAGKTINSTSGTAKPIKAGGRYLVFASRLNQTENRFTATGGSAGIFQVLEDGQLDPLLGTSQPNPDFRGASFDDIARKVQAAPR